jgi:hypothetical protein
VNETMVYNARFWLRSRGSDWVLVLVAMACINKFGFGVGRAVGRYTRFHKRRYFSSGLLIANIIGTHQAVYLFEIKFRRFFSCTIASSTFPQLPRHQIQ